MLLKITNVSIHYGLIEAIKDISMTIHRGEITTLVGSNGSGKSTILRTISGLKSPTRGEIFLNDKIVNHFLPEEIVRAGIGHVPEGRNPFPFMTVMENLRLGAFLRKDKIKIDRDMEVLFKHFPILKERKRQKARTLSGGEQQMLVIARALMSNPILLLMDEPSLGLAPVMVSEIGRIIRDINVKGTSILLVEQNARLALKLANKGYVLENGRIVLEGEGKELIESEHVKRAYLGG